MSTKSRWFKDTIQFACTQCGKCCKGRTNVFLNSHEAEAISSHLNLTKFEFSKNYTEEKEVGDKLLISLKSKVDNGGGCVFLKDNKCSIYNVRPTQCRTYPFWPQHLVGDAEWHAESRNCEGIQIQSNVQSSTSKSHTVSKDVVLTNLVLHMVHDRGLGPDWTYDESLENLQDSFAEQPQLLAEFEDDFFSTHYSSTVFRNSNIVVVDSTTPAPTAEPDVEEGVDTVGERVEPELESLVDEQRMQELMDALLKPITPEEAAQPAPQTSKTDTKLISFRRMEFASQPNVTQSEVKLALSTEGDSAAAQIDHSVVSLPVHKVLAEVFLRHILKLFLYTNKPDMRVAMIGAGGCVLPSHLLQATAQVAEQSPLPHPKLRIDAVEPDADVLMAAERFFGAKFDSESLVRRQTDGISFLSAANQQGATFDLVVLDAFEPWTTPSNSDSSNSSGSERSRAPPASLVDGYEAVKEALTAVRYTTSAQPSALLANHLFSNSNGSNDSNNSGSVSSTDSNSSSNNGSGSAASLHGSSAEDNGLLVVNVFGDAHWLRKTMNTFNVANGFHKPIVIVVGQSDHVHENNYVLITSPVTVSGQDRLSRVEELTNSLLVTGGEMFSSQVVNNGVIFMYNHQDN